MPDISTIASALSSVKTATDIVKLLKDSGLTLEKAEQRLKLAELLSALAELRIQLADVQQVVVEKEKRIKGLEERLDVKAKLRWEQPYYWVIDGDKKDGPFCQQCNDKDGKLIRLQGEGNGLWDCKTCKSIYTDSSYRAQEVTVKTDFDSRW